MGAMEGSIFVKLVAVPMCVALLALLMACVTRRWHFVSAMLWAMGLAASFFIADWLLRGGSEAWWPADVTRRLPYFALLTALIAGREAICRNTPTKLRFAELLLERSCISLLVAWQLTGLATPQLVWLSIAGAVLLLSWTCLALPLPIQLSWLTLGTWALVAGATGGILTLAGSASLGLVSVALGVALGCIALIHFRWRLPAWQSAAGVLVVTLMGLVLSGQQFAELPVSSAALIFASPLSVLLLHLPWLQQRIWMALVVVILSTLMLLALAAYLAQPVPVVNDSPPTSNPYADYYRK